MVDPDILRSKTQQILHHTDQLSAKHNLKSDDLEKDEDLVNIVLMDLQQANQGCIDLAIHACVDEELGAPSTAAQAFLLLSNHRRLDSVLTERQTLVTGLLRRSSGRRFRCHA